MYAVILAGGQGTRFWPLSREMYPKQLLKIFGSESMIQQTILHIQELVATEDTLIVTSDRLAEEIQVQLKALLKESFKGMVLTEPQPKNTAIAIGLASIYLKAKSKDGVIVVLPADHVIREKKKFLQILRSAEKIAKEGYLVTLGIRPKRPETGYGYIKAGARGKGQGSRLSDYAVYKVERFAEKPDLETAKGYLEKGNYFWNSGIFVWRVDTVLQEIKKHLPYLYKGLIDIERALGTKNEKGIIRKVYADLKPVSIDYGVMEKSKKVVVIPCEIGWSDVGSWSALDEVADKNERGNIVSGNVVDMGSKSSVLYGGKRLLATIGLKDMIVVDTDDATLVCPKDRAQDVKDVVSRLKGMGAEESLIHRTVYRSWGYYTVLEKNDRYKIKRIVINPGARLSLQLHHHRSEHWVVVSGTARVTNGDKVFNVHENESTYIPMSTKHRLENPGIIPLQIIEIQNGTYLEEDDIVRFDDEYERHKGE